MAHHYHLGEVGSLLNASSKTPQDSAGSAHFTNAIGGPSATIETWGVCAPGSTAYLSTATTTNEGWYGADVSSLATNNFASGDLHPRSKQRCRNSRCCLSIGTQQQQHS
ncbi:MAG: hypothetical protein QNL68_08465 [Akkermansiaceae bacterium]